ncbi:hypothetical protein DPMN_142044 [Dreissena polymorpha]|uniref:Uncharacterized protein n=1 Tax=Dreissena polymorpha TaxID=45954 RepID=A0A9D4GDU6_DREPO|nr:hypothetical protein DPMN_142044 [Dreissena polymorpha]
MVHSYQEDAGLIPSVGSLDLQQRHPSTGSFQEKLKQDYCQAVWSPTGETPPFSAIFQA